MKRNFPDRVQFLIGAVRVYTMFILPLQTKQSAFTISDCEDKSGYEIGVK